MSNMRSMDTSTNTTAPQTPLGFEEWIQDLDARSFDERADGILDALEASGRELHFAFQRHEAPPGRAQRSYRAEVSRIPVMDRAEEQRFAMGVELLWRRLQRVRRAAGLTESRQRLLFVRGDFGPTADHLDHLGDGRPKPGVPVGDEDSLSVERRV